MRASTNRPAAAGASRVRTLVPALLVLVLGLLVGCQSAQQRGMAGSTYVSTSRPAVTMTARDIPLVTAGRGSGQLFRPNMTGVRVYVRTAVYASAPDKPMAVVAHAELPNDWWIWTTVLPRVGAIHESTEVIDGVAFTAFTYLVPRKNDPFGGLAGESTQTPEDAKDLPEQQVDAHWIARYFAARTNFNRDKLILEYREPAPAGLRDLSSLPYGTTDAIAAFEKRAREAFSLGVPSDDLGPVVDGYPRGVRWQYMSDSFLGDVMQLEPMDLYN